jgi:hypothetical protein
MASDFMVTLRFPETSTSVPAQQVSHGGQSVCSGIDGASTVQQDVTSGCDENFAQCLRWRVSGRQSWHLSRHRWRCVVPARSDSLANSAASQCRSGLFDAFGDQHRLLLDDRLEWSRLSVPPAAGLVPS